MSWDDYTSSQKAGSEYSGVNETGSSVQPKKSEALSNGEKLRLGYVTGVENDPESIADSRQFWGLRPADGARPYWLDNTGIPSEAEIREVGNNDDGTPRT
ncbi:hypothetical protein ACWIG4_30180 [Streptomyces sp. NPDC002248]